MLNSNTGLSLRESNNLPGAGGFPETTQKYPTFDSNIWPMDTNKGTLQKEQDRPKSEDRPVFIGGAVEDLEFSLMASNLSKESSIANKESQMQDKFAEIIEIQDNRKARQIKDLSHIPITATSVVVPKEVIDGPNRKQSQESKSYNSKTSIKYGVNDKKIEHEYKGEDLLDGEDYLPNPAKDKERDEPLRSPYSGNEIQIVDLIDTVKNGRELTQQDSSHDHFADEDTLYCIHDLMSKSKAVQTEKKANQERRPEFLSNAVDIKIIEAKTIKDGMFKVYTLYTIQTKIPGQSATEFIVHRRQGFKLGQICNDVRYSDFDWFFEHLSNKYPGHVIPVLPPKNIRTALKMESNEFFEARKRELVIFLKRCMQHPFLRSTDDLDTFLTDDRGFYSMKDRETNTDPTWWNSNLLSTLINIVSSAAKGESTQPVFREITSADNELYNYEIIFGSLSKRLQALSEYMKKFLQHKAQSTNVTTSFALKIRNLTRNQEDSLQKSQGSLAAWLENGVKEESLLIKDMLEQTENELKDIINSVEAVNIALKKRNQHIKELNELQHIVELKSLKAKKDLASDKKLEDLKSECASLKEDFRKSSNSLLEEINLIQKETEDNLSNFYRCVYESNEKCLQKALELWRQYSNHYN